MNNWFIQDGKVLMVDGKIRGCCCREVEYAIRNVGAVTYTDTDEEEFAGMPIPDQYARIGQIWGALYPPNTYYGNMYRADHVGASQWNTHGAAEEFGATSSGAIYEIYNPITNQPLVGTAYVSGVRYDLSLTETDSLDNPTTGFMGIGSSSSLPSGVPCNWDHSIFSSSVPASSVFVPAFTSSRYFWIMKKLTNAADAGGSSSVNWISMSRSVSASLSVYYATAFK